MKKLLIISILLISFGLLTVNLVQAAGFHTGPILPCGWGDKPACALCHLWQLASNIINFVSFNLALPVAMLLFVVAGVIFMISGGDESKVTLARNIFTNVVIGLLIIFCSWLIIDTLLKTIAVGGFSGAWNQFPACQ
ncbi:MAG: pilin [Patescibacteria group bacterium]